MEKRMKTELNGTEHLILAKFGNTHVLLNMFYF